MYIKPIITYTAAVRSPFISKTNWINIEAVHKIAIQTITGVNYLTSNITLDNLRELHQSKTTPNEQPKSPITEPLSPNSLIFINEPKFLKSYQNLLHSIN